MKIHSKPFVALDTAWKKKNEFQKARCKLTALYVFILLIILNVFTFSIFGILEYENNKYTQNIEFQWREKSIPFPGQNITVIELEKTVNPYLTKEEALMMHTAFLKTIKFHLLWIESLLLIFSGFFSYFLAGKTLKPIQEKMESQTQFLSDVSHELKNPLAALQTTLDISLLQKNWKKGEINETLKDLRIEVKRLSGITENLLFLEKNVPVKKSKISLEYILKSVQKKLTEFAKELGISINFSSKNPQKIYGNEDDLIKLFFNLLHNAIKFSSMNQSIEIRLQKNSVEIENTGKTMSKEFQSKLFNRFSKEDTSRDLKYEGAGIGLSIVKKIADEHNAQIEVKSENKKTVFTLTFPQLNVVGAL